MTIDNGSREFDWADGVEFDITDEASIVKYFNESGDSAGGADDSSLSADGSDGTDLLDAASGAGSADSRDGESTAAGGEEDESLDAFLTKALGEYSEEEKAGETGEKPPEGTTPPEPKNYEALSKEFENAVGVPIKDALSYVQNFEQTAQSTIEKIQAAEANLSLRMQEMELKVAWSQEASRSGQDLSELVEHRLTETAKVYQQLTPQQQAHVARAGSKGVMALWQRLERKAAPSPQRGIPTGRADIAGSSNDAPKLSEVVAIDDDTKYWQAMEQYYRGQLPVRNDINRR